jgi:hypothetical protein
LTATEIGVLDHLVNDKPKARQKTLSHYLIKSPGSAVISPAPAIRRPAIPSCGAGCHASTTSCWAPWSSEENLWVIESLTGGLHLFYMGHVIGMTAAWPARIGDAEQADLVRASKASEARLPCPREAQRPDRVIPSGAAKP